MHKRLLAQLSALEQFLLVTLLCQIAFWYLGSPGPVLLSSTERDLLSALKIIIASVIFLVGIPLLWLRLHKIDLNNLGVSFGDLRFGLLTVLGISIVAIPILFFATQSHDLQLTYPWSGEWAGKTLAKLFLWMALYSIYYLSYEFFYRGFILKAGEKFFTPQLCMYLQVLFSVMIHLGKPLPETLAAVPAGFLFGWLAIKTKSLIYPVLLHLIIGAATDSFSLYHQDLLLFLR